MLTPAPTIDASAPPKPRPRGKAVEVLAARTSVTAASDMNQIETAPGRRTADVLAAAEAAQLDLPAKRVRTPKCGPLDSLSVGKEQVRKIEYICSVRIFYVHYNHALYILQKPACYHCGGCGRAGDIRLAGAGDLLARRAVASPALAAVLRPAMGLCGEGCALLARLRPLVRVAGGPGGNREVSAPHISLSMRVASTSLTARTGGAVHNGGTWLSCRSPAFWLGILGRGRYDVDDGWWYGGRSDLRRRRGLSGWNFPLTVR